MLCLDSTVTWMFGAFSNKGMNFALFYTPGQRPLKPALSAPGTTPSLAHQPQLNVLGNCPGPLLQPNLRLPSAHLHLAPTLGPVMLTSGPTSGLLTQECLGSLA